MENANTSITDTSNVAENDNFKWYSLWVISGKERSVEDNIAYESKMNEITKFIKEVFVPFEKVVLMKNNDLILTHRRVELT